MSQVCNVLPIMLSSLDIDKWLDRNQKASHSLHIAFPNDVEFVKALAHPLHLLKAVHYPRKLVSALVVSPVIDSVFHSVCHPFMVHECI